MDTDKKAMRNQSGDAGTHIGHDGGTLTITNATLKFILRAYGVADAQVAGPAWLDTDRYDIIAKATADADRSASFAAADAAGGVV